MDRGGRRFPSIVVPPDWKYCWCNCTSYFFLHFVAISLFCIIEALLQGCNTAPPDAPFMRSIVVAVVVEQYKRSALRFIVQSKEEEHRVRGEKTPFDLKHLFVSHCNVHFYLCRKKKFYLLLSLAAAVAVLFVGVVLFTRVEWETRKIWHLSGQQQQNKRWHPEKADGTLRTVRKVYLCLVGCNLKRLASRIGCSFTFCLCTICAESVR